MAWIFYLIFLEMLSKFFISRTVYFSASWTIDCGKFLISLYFVIMLPRLLDILLVVPLIIENKEKIIIIIIETWKNYVLTANAVFDSSSSDPNHRNPRSKWVQWVIEFVESYYYLPSPYDLMLKFVHSPLKITTVFFFKFIQFFINSKINEIENLLWLNFKLK